MGGQCRVRSPQSQAWSPHGEASSLQWVPGAIRGRDRQVSLMFWGMVVRLLPPQVSQMAGWAVDSAIFFVSFLLTTPFPLEDSFKPISVQGLVRISLYHESNSWPSHPCFLGQLGKMRPTEGQGSTKVMQWRTVGLAQRRGLRDPRSSLPPCSIMGLLLNVPPAS